MLSPFASSLPALSIIETALPFGSTIVPLLSSFESVLFPVTIHFESSLIYRFAYPVLLSPEKLLSHRNAPVSSEPFSILKSSSLHLSQSTFPCIGWLSAVKRHFAPFVTGKKPGCSLHRLAQGNLPTPDSGRKPSAYR